MTFPFENDTQQYAFVFVCIHMTVCSMHHTINSVHYAWVNSFKINATLYHITLFIENDFLHGICFCMHSYECMYNVSCIMHYKLGIMHMYLRHCIIWLFLLKITSHKANVYLFCMHPYECMHYAIYIVHYAWVNSLQIFASLH